MTSGAWVAVGTLLLVGAGVVGAIWKVAQLLGEIRIGVKEMLTRDARMVARVDAIDLRVNDHGERISALEGYRKGKDDHRVHA